ncbi:Zn-dependent hydrolase [Arthrobacter sp. ERGS1:01]|uniref:MBL fold metallo-hydrolase n=1 Tax=Arthrobacter sp. ERGS1:01 TaxID=1704044 RepID=UPI0006B67C75|nr:MBL fold metallo-hydrolase [Arthrobacter sp. ERGS1:01]ALE05121.1 Zn-dependent hydrolase [Arthrobacter sp. ERGS1:01]
MADIERTGPLSRSLRAANPGPMTLDGTNTYLLGAPGSGTVVVDPGPLLEDHLAALAAAGPVELILVTHEHPDHTEGSARLHELTGAPVRAASADYCHGGEPLRDGEVIRAAGVEITVLATPGHTADSVCFVLTDPALKDTSPNDGAPNDDAGAVQVLTGDTVLGQGSTVICYPDGRLGDYLASLEKLRAIGAQGAPVTVLPGHGPVLPDLAAIAAAYQAHRQDRLAQVRAAVELLEKDGREATAESVTAEVYGDVPANLQGAAQLSVEAQLDYLRGATSAP